MSQLENKSQNETDVILVDTGRMRRKLGINLEIVLHVDLFQSSVESGS